MHKFILLIISLSLTGCHIGNSGIWAELEAAQARSAEGKNKTAILLMSSSDLYTDKRIRALAKAAGRGDIKQIDKLVKAGVDVNSKGVYSTPVLFWAMRQNSVKGFEKLLQLGATTDEVFAFKNDATHIKLAVLHKNPDFMKLLLEYGANPNIMDVYTDTPLRESIIHRKKDRFDMLLAAGADLNVRRFDGSTPLMTATFTKWDMLYRLLESGADYKLRDNRNRGVENYLAYSLSNVAPEYLNDKWLLKSIAWLNERGVKIPKNWKEVP